MFRNDTGNQNTAIGYVALFKNTTISNLTAIGANALYNNTDGVGLVATGSHALYSNTTGNYNTANGFDALFNNTNGSKNTAYGYQSLYNNSVIGNNNTAVGYQSLFRNTNGFANTANGYQAGFNSTGGNNVFIGYQSGYNEITSGKLYIESTNADADNALIYGEFGLDNTSTNNILRTNSQFQIGNPTGTGFAFPIVDGTVNQVLQTDGSGTLAWVNSSSLGAQKINDLTDGKSDSDGSENGSSVFLGVDAGFNDYGTNNKNVGIGFGTLYNNTTGNLNTANGYQALYTNTTGYHNTGYGTMALFNNTTGHFNTANGIFALINNTMGVANTANGYEALYLNTTGSNNIANGFGALFNNTTASNNTANGYRALFLNTTGSNNTAVGYQADVGSDNLTNATAIGANTVVSQNNSLVLGNDVKVGIGISAPKYKLHVGDGNINAVNGSNTRMVVSDNDNNQRAAVLGLAKTSAGARVEAQLEANGSTTQGPSVIVGAVSSHPLYIRTGNITRMTVTTAGSVGIGTSIPAAKLHVVGNICYTGSIGACSDIRYKNNLIPVSQILPKLKSIGVYTYKWDTVNFPEKGFTKERQLGVIAQELELYFPELVQTDREGYKTVDYAKMSALLLQGLKEQQSMYEDQQENLIALQSEINRLSSELGELKNDQNQRIEEIEKNIALLSVQHQSTVVTNNSQ